MKQELAFGFKDFGCLFNGEVRIKALDSRWCCFGASPATWNHWRRGVHHRPRWAG